LINILFPIISILPVENVKGSIIGFLNLIDCLFYNHLFVFRLVFSLILYFVTKAILNISFNISTVVFHRIYGGKSFSFRTVITFSIDNHTRWEEIVTSICSNEQWHLHFFKLSEMLAVEYSFFCALNVKVRPIKIINSTILIFMFFESVIITTTKILQNNICRKHFSLIICLPKIE
jgi:hypothetical protein